MFSRCPGAAGFAEPIPEPIRCPHCGREVEIFTNEQSMKCYFCGGTVSRKSLPSCLDWCKYADLCRAEIEAQRSR
jgi:DNA-directed RNA polymerase subunit RPC12/RpoP